MPSQQSNMAPTPLPLPLEQMPGVGGGGGGYLPAGQVTFNIRSKNNNISMFIPF